MSDDNPEAAGARKTLKLRRPIAKAATQPPPSLKPQPKREAVDWAAEHKERMQADMDAIAGKK